MNKWNRPEAFELAMKLWKKGDITTEEFYILINNPDIKDLEVKETVLYYLSLSKFLENTDVKNEKNLNNFKELIREFEYWDRSWNYYINLKDNDDKSKYQIPIDSDDFAKQLSKRYKLIKIKC